MKTLELHYAQTYRYEDEDQAYGTWFWNDDETDSDYGWNKRPVPNFISTEEEQAKEWFRTSNREDLIFLEKEKMACQYWYDKEKTEIYKHEH